MNPQTCDWMKSAAAEIVEDNLTHGSPLSRHEVNALAAIIAKHAPRDQSQQLAAAKSLVDKLLKSVSDGDALLLQASANIQEHIGHGDELERKLAAAQARIAELEAREDRQTGSWNTLGNGQVPAVAALAWTILSS